MAALFRKLTRQQLAQFLKSPDLIRAFEQLQDAIASTETPADGSISLDQLQDIGSPSLLGRGSPGAGPPEQIALGTGLTMVGNTLNAAAAPGGGGLTRGAGFSGAGYIINPALIEDVSITVPTARTITSWTVLTHGGVGSCEVDVWKTPYVGYPPTVANTICGGNYPRVVVGDKGQDLALPGWVTAVAAGDVLTFHLRSSSIFTTIAVLLELS